MSERISIENRSKLSMGAALHYVKMVIEHGRISNNKTNYCYVTTWSGDNIVIYAHKNKKSDRFVVSRRL